MNKVCLVSLVVFSLSFAAEVLAQNGHHASDTSGHHLDYDDEPNPHLSHPIVAESPSPDTKVRLDYEYERIEEDDVATDISYVVLEGEYAFHPSVSVEIDVPFVSRSITEGPSESRIGNVILGLKFANYAFGSQGILLGYGIEFALPTGDDESGVGSDHILEIEPFFNVGYQSGRVEVVTFASFGIPTNQEEGDEIETEFIYSLSLLYRFTPRLQGLIEVDGESVLSGEHEESLATLSPGFKFRPFPGRSLFVGAGAGVPISGGEYDVRLRVALFYHF